LIFLACIALILSLAQLFVAIINLFFRQDLPSPDSGCERLVSVLIPARNEEKNIGSLLSDLVQQDHPDMEMLVYDDFSADKTSLIVSEWILKDGRIRLIPAVTLPDGWTGKNYACHMLSKAARGDCLLFLDADVRLDKDVITRAVAFYDKFKPGLLSVFPDQVMITTGEKIIVPNMHFILLSLLPLIMVWKSAYPSLAAANGQFMLFDAARYHKLLPHEKVRGKMVEDIEIARYLKRENIRVACTAGIQGTQCRMYSGFNEAVEGFSRNVFAYFGNSFILAFLFWFFTTFGIVFIIAALSLAMIMVYIALIIITRVIVSLTGRQNVLQNLILFIPQQLALGLIIYRSLIKKLKGEHRWKGRKIIQ
jgi:glycosyltransferase involved in cell wall biosynthesis